MFPNRKRVSILKNGTRTGGKVVFVPNTWDEFLNIASGKLLIDARRAYNANGCELDSIVLICHDDVLYIAGDEPFISLGDIGDSNTAQVKPATGESDSNKKETKTKQEKQGNIIKLNVGGKVFETTLSTLLKEPNSLLVKMFCPIIEMDDTNIDETGALFIDRDPTYFKFILNYIRTGNVIVNDHIRADIALQEAKFFGIDSLVKNWSDFSYAFEKSYTRNELAHILNKNVYESNITLRYINCNHVDLSGIYFNSIDFANASFRSCNLFGATFADCILDNVNFEGSTMQNVIFNSSGYNVNFEGANLQGVTFPRNTKLNNCNFKDAIAKNITIEGSISFDSCNFVNASLDHTIKVDKNFLTFQKCDFTNASFTYCSFIGVIFDECILNKANFKSASLIKVNFSSFKYRKINFEGATLEKVNFDRNAKLYLCNFDEAIVKSIVIEENLCFDSCSFEGATLDQSMKAAGKIFLCFDKCDFTNVCYM